MSNVTIQGKDSADRTTVKEIRVYNDKHIGSSARDSEGNEILPAFSPSNTIQMTAATTSSNQALGTATSVRLHGTEIAAIDANDIIRVAFGTSAITALATDMPVTIHATVEPTILYIPSTATHIAVIRDGAADVTVELTLS